MRRGQAEGGGRHPGGGGEFGGVVDLRRLRAGVHVEHRGMGGGLRQGIGQGGGGGGGLQLVALA